MITATQKDRLVALFESGAKALSSGTAADMGRASLLISEALDEMSLTSADVQDLAEEALMREGIHKYQFAPVPDEYVPFEDELNEFAYELSDEDYYAGWGMSRSEVLGEQIYPDYMSTFDHNDYEYQQELVYG